MTNTTTTKLKVYKTELIVNKFKSLEYKYQHSDFGDEETKTDCKLIDYKNKKWIEFSTLTTAVEDTLNEIEGVKKKRVGCDTPKDWIQAGIVANTSEWLRRYFEDIGIKKVTQIIKKNFEDVIKK